jgi:hypothetical protein
MFRRSTAIATGMFAWGLLVIAVFAQNPVTISGGYATKL